MASLLSRRKKGRAELLLTERAGSAVPGTSPEEARDSLDSMEEEEELDML